MNNWFVALTTLVFGLALTPLSRPGAGWFWEVGNGLGFGALAALLYLCLDTRRGGKVRAHQLVGYVATALLCAHVLWFLLGDATVLQYAQLGAPWSMWSAWLALLLLLMLVLTSLPGLRPSGYLDHPAFRRWHRWLTVLVLLAAGHHMIDSAFYLGSPAHGLLLAALAGAVLWLPLQRVPGVRAAHPLATLALFALAIALFTTVKGLAL